jgi:hypothetical protein
MGNCFSVIRSPSTGAGALCTASAIALGRVVGLTPTGPSCADQSVTAPSDAGSPWESPAKTRIREG